MSETTMKIIIYGFVGLGFLFGLNTNSMIPVFVTGSIGFIVVVLISYLNRKK